MGPSQTLKIGSGAPGSLSISANGSVVNGIGVIGETASGLVEIQGGSWSNSDTLIVGLLAPGTLNLGSGSLSSAGGVISQSSYVNVTGGTWTNGGSLVVGSSGYGRLEISGGSVTNSGATIGSGAGVSGEVAVLGGNWSSSGVVSVGTNGTGNLVVSGGNVRATEVGIATQGGSQGALSIAAGVLTASNIWKGSGTGNVTFSGGTLRLSTTQSRLFDNFGDGQVVLAPSGGASIDTNGFSASIQTGLAGSGPLAKLGNQTLTLRGNNTYSGGTVIRGGTLAIATGGRINHPSAGIEIGSLAGEDGTLLISGGTVAVSGANIGSNAGSTGALRITSGELAAGSINAGIFGDGSLEIAGGNVTAGSVTLAVSANSTGFMNLSGGVLTTGQISSGLGNGSITLGAGTVRLSAAQSSLFAGFAGGGVTVAGAATIDTQSHNVATAQSLSGNGSLTKAGSGTLTLTGNTTLANGVAVSGGRLDVRGSLDGGVAGISVASGAVLTGNGQVVGPVDVSGSLEGTGTFGRISGSGSVDPGNSPGILTATSVNLASNLSFHFEANSSPGALPDYGNATQSGNDVLRLTGPDPFSSSPATAANAFNVYLGITSLTYGDVFLAGIYTDRNSDFGSIAAGGTFNYFVYGDGNGTVSYNGKNYYTLAQFDSALGMAAGAVQIPVASFGDGAVTNGWQQTFTVVPEASTTGLLALAGPLLALLLSRGLLAAPRPGGAATPPAKARRRAGQSLADRGARTASPL